MEHKVTLLAYTPEPQRIIAGAARLCYSKSGGEELIERIDDESAAEFIDMLSDLGHQSPIEHASFTFLIEGVSRSLLAQITRHRIASFSVRSQRYVKEGQFEYVVPPEIASEPEALTIFTKSMEDAQKSYNALSDILEKKHFETFIAQGKPEREARRAASKKAIEDARFVLPNSCETKMIVTMNARSLHNFFRLRCCSRAQWEIRAVAVDMLKEVKRVTPTLFKNAGPGCVSGACSEGKMTCGRAAEMRAFYRGL
ncbi:MAG: FAD-dependent thymidylate synthase [Clostridia bacterium]|nr:FAD-dependent thymidylate synthase [Clostridia bacterium]